MPPMSQASQVPQASQVSEGPQLPLPASQKEALDMWCMQRFPNAVLALGANLWQHMPLAIANDDRACSRKGHRLQCLLAHPMDCQKVQQATVLLHTS